jgi:hypothetical protein
MIIEGDKPGIPRFCERLKARRTRKGRLSNKGIEAFYFFSPSPEVIILSTGTGNEGYSTEVTSTVPSNPFTVR